MLRYAHDIIAGYSMAGGFGLERIAATNMLCVNGRPPRTSSRKLAAKLVEGTRTYRTDMTLEQNLERTIESDIIQPSEEGVQFPGQMIAQPSKLRQCRTIRWTSARCWTARNAAEKFEQASREKEMLAELMKSVEGDEDLTLILMAYEERNTHRQRSRLQRA